VTDELDIGDQDYGRLFTLPGQGAMFAAEDYRRPPARRDDGGAADRASDRATVANLAAWRERLER
jgi:hypothetical protein